MAVLPSGGGDGGASKTRRKNGGGGDPAADEEITVTVTVGAYAGSTCTLQSY
jgi:hypothetical protein